MSEVIESARHGTAVGAEVQKFRSSVDPADGFRRSVVLLKESVMLESKPSFSVAAEVDVCPASTTESRALTDRD